MEELATEKVARGLRTRQALVSLAAQKNHWACPFTEWALEGASAQASSQAA